MKKKLIVRGQFLISFAMIAIGLIWLIPWVLEVEKKSRQSSSDFHTKLNVVDDESFESKLNELEVVNNEGLEKSIEVSQTSSSQTNSPEKNQQNLLERSSTEEVIEISESTNTFDSLQTQMNQDGSRKTAENNAESLSVFVKEKFAEIFKKTAQVTRETTKAVQARALDLGGKIARATTQTIRVVQEKSVEIAKKTAQATRETTKAVQARAFDLGGKIARATTLTIRVVQEKSVEIAKKTAQVTSATTKAVQARTLDFGGKIARATTQTIRVVQEKSVEIAKKTAQVTSATTKAVQARTLDFGGKIARATTQTIRVVQEKSVEIAKKTAQVTSATTKAVHTRVLDLGKKIARTTTQTIRVVQEKSVEIAKKTAQVTSATTKAVQARALDLGGKIARTTTQTIRVVQEKSVEIAKKTAQVTSATTKAVQARALDLGGKIARTTTQTIRVVQEKSVEIAKKTAQVTSATTKAVQTRALDLGGKIAQMATQTIGFVQEKSAGLIKRITPTVQSLPLATNQKDQELAVDEPILSGFPRDADSDKKGIPTSTETSEPVREKVADLETKVPGSQDTSIQENPEQRASLDGLAIVEKSVVTEVSESSRTPVVPVMQSETVQKDPVRTNLEISVHETVTDSGKKTEQEKEFLHPEITQSEKLQQASAEIEESVKSPIQTETVPLACPDSPSTSIPVQNILEPQKQAVSIESVPSKEVQNESNQTLVEMIQKPTSIESTKTEKESSSVDSSPDQVSCLFETKMDVAVNENRETNRTELKVIIDANQKVNQSQLKDKVVQSQDGGKDCLEITCAVLDDENESDPDKGNSVDIQVKSTKQKSTKEGVKYPSETVKVVSKHSPTEKSELTDASEHSPAPVIPAVQSEMVQKRQEQTTEPNRAMVTDLDKKMEPEVVSSTSTDVSASLPMPAAPTIQAETMQKDQVRANPEIIDPDHVTVADVDQKNESRVLSTSESTKTVSSYGNVALDILYWEGIEDDLRYAMKNYSAFYPTSPAVNQKWGYDLGVRASFFVPIFYDQWSTGVTFTHFYSTPPITRVEDPTGNIYANLNFPMIGPESFQNVYSASGKWTLKMNVIDLELKRTFIIAQSLKIQPSLGGKASWIRQKVDVHYHYVYPNFTFANRIRGFSSIWGVGPEIGVEMIFVIPKQWNLSIKGTYAGMVGLFTGNTTYSEYDDTDYESALTEKKSLLFDVTQLQCGLSKWWTFKKECSLGLTAGWEFQIWRRQMRMNWWSTATFPNQGADLTVKGPFFRGTVNF